MESLTIRDDYGRNVPMKFLESQEILWDHVAPRLDTGERMRFVVLKGRQVCASTFFENLIFCRTLERPGTQSLVLAQDLDTSHDLFSMAKRFYDHLPMPKFKPAKIKEILLPFPTGTSIFRVVSAGVSSKGRGTNNTCVHGSETAFWPHPEIWTGLAQVIPDIPGTIAVLESTANGKRGAGELFYKAWKQAISGESEKGYVPIFIPWHIMKKYRGSYIGIPPLRADEWDEEEKALNEALRIDGDQLAWRRWAIPNRCRGDVEQFRQEFPATPEEAFISTGLPAFDRLSIMRQRENVKLPSTRMRITVGSDIKKAKMENDPTGELRVWRLPQTGHQYVIGADTAEGLEGGDSTCAEVIDMATLEQVACVHGKIAPWDFAIALNTIGNWYNNAIVAIEVNNTGHAVQDHMIRTLQYPNLHPWRGKPDRVRTGKAKLYGWETNSYSRPLLIEAGRRVVNKILCTIHEEKLLEELHDFSRSDSGKYEAESGEDDRVMAFLVALRSREENYYPARAKIEVSDETNFPAGVRVVDEPDAKATTHRRISRLLKDKAKAAAQAWMEM